MISGGQLLGFAVASLVLIVIPGPGGLFVIGRALGYGRRSALATAVGHAAGNYVVAAGVVTYGMQDRLDQAQLRDHAVAAVLSAPDATMLSTPAQPTDAVEPGPRVVAA